MSNGKTSQPVTEAHVEAIIDKWGQLTMAQMAQKLDLEVDVVEDIVAEIKKLKRAAVDQDISPAACLSTATAQSIVRCVGAKRGYGD